MPTDSNENLPRSMSWAQPDTTAKAGGYANRNAEKLRAKSSVRSVLPVCSHAGQIRRPKVEGRNPKAETRTALGLRFRSSDFGTRPSFGPRTSGFGLQSYSPHPSPPKEERGKQPRIARELATTKAGGYAHTPNPIKALLRLFTVRKVVCACTPNHPGERFLRQLRLCGNR